MCGKIKSYFGFLSFNKKPKEIGGIKKVIQDIGVIGISRIILTLSGIILLPVLTKNIGAYGYGLWSQAIITISLSLILLRLGFDLSIPRLFPGKNIEKVKQDFYSILTLTLITSTLLSLILFLYPKILANAIFDGNIIIVRIIAIIIFISSFEKTLLSVLHAFREMKKYAILNILATFVETILAIYFVLLGYGIIGAILAILIVRLLSFIILFIVVHKKLPFTKPKIISLKEYLRLGIPTIPGSISSFIVEMSDRYIIGIFLGTTFVGYYVPGYSLAKIIPALIGSLLAFVLLPTLSGYYEKNNIKMVKNILNLSTKFFLLISVPSLIGMILLGKTILRLFTTPDIANQGYIILVLISFVGIFDGLFRIHMQSIFLKKRTKLIAFFWLFGALINLMGNLIFIPKLGIIAAALTSVFSYFFVTLFVLFFSLKKIHLNFDYTSIAKIVLSSIIMGFIIYYIKNYLLNNYFILILIGIAIYLIAIYLLKGLNKNEINFIKNIF